MLKREPQPSTWMAGPSCYWTCRGWFGSRCRVSAALRAVLSFTPASVASTGLMESRELRLQQGKE